MELKIEPGFAQVKTLRTLFGRPTKHLVLLISVGQEYHNGPYLEATKALIEKYIILEQKLSNTPEALWQIDIIVADTLQAYNEAIDHVSLRALQEKWKQVGQEWRAVAERVFAPVSSLSQVCLSFHHWDDLLARSAAFGFEEDFSCLTHAYYSINENFKVNVDHKASHYQQRQLKRSGSLSAKGATKYKIQYILEEIAILKGSLSKGLLDRVISSDPIVLIYPSMEEKAFKTGEELLFTKASNCRVQWHELKLSTQFEQALNHEQVLMSVLDELGLLKVNERVFPSLFPHNSHFVKREEYAEYLGRLSELKSLVFYGLGGMGKTTILADFFNTCFYENRYDYCMRFMVEKGKKRHFSIQIRQFFKRVKVTSVLSSEIDTMPDEQLQDYFFQWLSEQESWFLVFEVQSYEEVVRFNQLVNKKRHIVVAARVAPPQEFSQGFCPILVGPMTPSEVKQMIINHRGPGISDEECEALQKRFEGFVLPLFLTLKYLEQNPNHSIADYLLESEDASVHSPTKKVINYTLCHIDPLQHSTSERSFARYLLFFATYLKCGDIDLKLVKAWFRHYYSEVDEIELDNALNLLIEYSLIVRHQNSLSLHPIVHEILTEIGREERFIPLKVELDNRLLKWHFSIAAGFSDVLWDNFDDDLDIVIPSYFNYISHLENYIDILRLQLHLYHRQLSSSEMEGLNNLISGLMPGDSELDMVRYVAKCGGIFSFFGNHEEGKSRLCEASEMLQVALNEQPSIAIIRALIKLAFLQHFLHYTDNSKGLFQNLVEAVQRIKEDHQPEMLKIFAALVHVFLQEGNLEQGLEFYLKLCANLLKTEGGPKLLLLLANLANEKSSQQSAFQNIAAKFFAELNKNTSNSNDTSSQYQPPN